MTAGISRSQFSYLFRVSPGQKFIRLHFYPASYPGFERSEAFFTVKDGPYTNLNNFNASLPGEGLCFHHFSREFCVNVEENRELTKTFSLSPAGFAFIIGIEIVSMPAGKKLRICIDNNIAHETVHRLNIGGGSISSAEDSSKFRRRSGDSDYLLDQLGVSPVTSTIEVKFMNIPTWTAPPRVYQTAWSINSNKQANRLYSFTWKLPVDLGFRYVVRLHFCKLEYREFSIFINNQVAEAYADVIEWNGENGVTVYRDYMVTMEGDGLEGKRDILVVVHHYYELGGLLKMLEVFKFSNPDNNLVRRFPECAPATSTPKVFAFGGVNTIATGVVILFTLLNVTVYQLRIWAEENYRERSISSSLTKNSCRRFSFHEIQLATDNFDDALVIGHGGFGKVYKGLIDDGATTVAIKRLNLESKQGPHEFWTEVEMLSKLRHVHLVTLIGYCKDFQEMILVYEYMAHGTLADRLYKTNREGNSISRLTWKQRLNICIGAAHGLDYLHRETQPRVIHRDVKSTNILLNDNWVAKISDFGLSKIDTTSQSHTHVSTDVKGTFGYIDPEYFSTHRLTWKTDVYAFGVVLLEALCGRKVVDTELEEEQHSLVIWAKQCIKEGTLDQIIDPALRGQILPRCLKVFVEVANKCLHKNPNGRPTMFDVVRSLEIALVSQGQRIDSSIEIEEVELELNLEAEDEDFTNVGRANFEEIIGITRLGGDDVQGTEGLMFEQDDNALQAKKKIKLTFSKLVNSFAFRSKGKAIPKKRHLVKRLPPFFR